MKKGNGGQFAREETTIMCEDTTPPPPTDPPTESPTRSPTELPTADDVPVCQDDPNWYFLNNKGKRKNCEWVANKKTDSRCQKVGNDGPHDGERASDACKSTCGNCS